MGLDMYLSATRYFWSHDAEDEKVKSVVAALLPETNGMEIKTVSIEAMYWRKANAIHKWFVNTLQDGVDKCQTTPVSWENLVQLRALCQSVVDDRSLAPDVLPSASGFFFGDTEYNEWYFQMLERTIEGINRIEKQLVTNTTEDGRQYSMWEFTYHSSW